MFKKLMVIAMSVIILNEAGLNGSARHERARKRAERALNIVEATSGTIKRRAKKRAMSAPDVVASPEDEAVTITFAPVLEEAPSVSSFVTEGLYPTGPIKRKIPKPGERSILAEFYDRYGRDNVRNYLAPEFKILVDGSLGGRGVNNSRYDSFRSNILRFVPGNAAYEPMPDGEVAIIADLKEQIIFDDLEPGNLLTPEEQDSLLTIFAPKFS